MSDTPAIDMCELGHKFYLNADMRRCPYCMALGLDSARAELSAANARIAELEKDAARYRWLKRSQLNGDEPFIARFECGSFSRWCGDMADSAIDDAMMPSQPTTLPESKQQK